MEGLKLKEGKYKCLVKDFTTGKESWEIIEVVKMSKEEKAKHKMLLEQMLRQFRGGKD